MSSAGRLKKTSAEGVVRTPWGGAGCMATSWVGASSKVTMWSCGSRNPNSLKRSGPVWAKAITMPASRCDSSAAAMPGCTQVTDGEGKRYSCRPITMPPFDSTA
jgi:hypothetical protein